MIIKIGRIPGRMLNVTLDNEEPTASDAMASAGIVLGSSESVEINGSRASTMSRVRPNDIVTIVADIKGGY